MGIEMTTVQHHHADNRPSWDEYFSRIAMEVSKRSTCLRRQVGAILVLDKRILATGYNGAPRDVRHCGEVGCLRLKHNVPSGERHELCRGLHGEMNALIQAAANGVRVEGATLYSTHFPCSLCAKMLINGGIKRIVAQGDYADALAKDLLGEAKLKVELYDYGTHSTVPFPMRHESPYVRQKKAKKAANPRKQAK